MLVNKQIFRILKIYLRNVVNLIYFKYKMVLVNLFIKDMLNLKILRQLKHVFKNMMIINLMEKDLSLKMLLKIIEISLEIKIQGIKLIKTFR